MGKKVLSFWLAVVIAISCMGLPTYSAPAFVQRDIILMLDVSGSMYGEPLNVLVDAAKSFCETVMSSADDNRIGIVIWSTVPQWIDFTSNTSSLISAIDTINSPGYDVGWGTDIGAALELANGRMDLSSRDSSIKSIVLMTDGFPEHGIFTTTGRYDSSDHPLFGNANTAYNIAANITDSYNLYTLGFFHSLGGVHLSFAKEFLYDIQNAGYHIVTDVDDLEPVFFEIAGDIDQEYSDVTPPLALFVDAPRSLKMNENNTAYRPNPFEITVFGQNVSSSSAINPQIELVLGEGLSINSVVVSQSALTAYPAQQLLALGDIEPDGTFAVTWQVSVSNVPGNADVQIPYKVNATYNTAETKSIPMILNLPKIYVPDGGGGTTPSNPNVVFPPFSSVENNGNNYWNTSDYTEVNRDPRTYALEDPATILNLPYDEFNTVVDEASAVRLVNKAISRMNEEQRQSSAGINLLTRFAEEAITQAAEMRTTDAQMYLNTSQIADLEAKAVSAKNAVAAALTNAGIDPGRELNANALISVTSNNQISFSINGMALSTGLNNIRVESRVTGFTLNLDLMRESSVGILAFGGNRIFSKNLMQNMYLASKGYVPGLADVFYAASNSQGTSATYTVSVTPSSSGVLDFKTSGNLPQNAVKIQLPIQSGKDHNTLVVADESGEAVLSQYNPATNKMEAKPSQNGKYVLKENVLDFSDLQNTSAEMRTAINYLATKGIMYGSDDSQFNPDGAVTRAEIAAFIVRSAGLLDNNANGGFSDVAQSKWYYGAVGSAKRMGIISGMSATEFAPEAVVLKDQITAIVARTTKMQRGFKAPADINAYLGKFTDNGDIKDWAKEDISLAVRENLVINRADKKFVPADQMTRGEAAIILYRLYHLIW
ncbi:MAG: S-layer homology domain-containing protein [Clostridiales bacterium]|jgi:hypothetical protein|nr:S-layer homology domain-containing protein [Clostridiales bacterium]